MSLIKTFFVFILALVIWGCNQNEGTKTNMNSDDNFKFLTEQFADLSILRYQVPGFYELTAKQKELVYYLYEAALAGRDIYYDQNYKYNLKVRRTLEAVVSSYKGDKNSTDFQNFMVYVKRVWFSNGIHHHYSTRKFIPDIQPQYFAELCTQSDASLFPLENGQTVDQLVVELTPIIFDPNVDAIKTNLDSNVDIVKMSAGNFYEGLTQKEVEDYYEKIVDKNDSEPISYGLNSKLIKENGQIVDKTYKVGGMYSASIEKIVYWLEKAVTVAENDLQKRTFERLIEFYKTSDLKKFDEYNILWVQDTVSVVDAVNGFIEVYNDPLGYRGAFESVVSIKDMEATKRIDAIGRQAQWFEDNSTIAPEHKKKNVVGISAKVITVVVESGDASPSTPIGINLPNANWIRKDHGSKSVNLGNIVYAYDKAGSEELLKEFCYSQEEIDLAKQHGSLAGKLHTDLHEVIGHASGQINAGVGTPKQSLKNYASAIEEARADLVALYYIMDPKLIEIGVMPSLDVAKAEYNSYLRNGLMLQLNRIELGDNIEQAHMRNRQTISKWVLEKGAKDNVIEKKMRDGKTFYVINDYNKLRTLFGEMLKEVQRITSEGDFAAAQTLIETYGVKIDPALHKEVRDRYAKLNVAPYKGFINPVLKPVIENGKIVDVKVEYPEDFTEQMLFYAKNHSFLPTMN
ncbi:MAG: dihydrofolate reductase [Ignavibacteriales bacterium]|nr:MAG: dihydrofolate reductase [Ignavibacteriales bacterium]